MKKHFKQAMTSAKYYATRLLTNKEITEYNLRAVLTTNMKPAQRDRIQKALNALGRIKI